MPRRRRPNPTSLGPVTSDTWWVEVALAAAGIAMTWALIRRRRRA